MRLPIRLRLTAWYVLLLAAVLVGVGAFTTLRLRSTLSREIDRSLGSAAPQLAQGYRSEGRKDFLDVANTVFPAIPAGQGTAQVLDARGRVLVAYGGASARRPMLGGASLAAAVRGRRTLATVSLDRDERFRVLALPVTRGDRSRVLVVAKSLHDRDQSVAHLLVLLVIAFPVALAVAAAGGWLLARRALRPVEDMTSRADAIGVDGLAGRIPVPGTRDEIGHLAATLNAMLERLERGVDERRRLVADASHELRTPLAAMQAELDVTLRYDELPAGAREVLGSTREEVEHMSALVANLLTLARIDDGRLELRDDRIELRDLLERVAGKLDPLAVRAGVELDVDGAPITVAGDREHVREVVSNLVMNAIKFAGRGARVRLATWEEPGRCGFLVGDDGPGIAVEAQPRIFDRFWRADASRARDRGGSGLGLAICREIVEAHGGRIWFDSDPGQGACFHVALPGAAALSRSSSVQSAPPTVPGAMQSTKEA